MSDPAGVPQHTDTVIAASTGGASSGAIAVSSHSAAAGASTIVAESTAGTQLAAVTGSNKSGRRVSDWHQEMLFRTGRSIFFWIFGMFLNDRHKPSMSRCMLALWTYCGWLLIEHEIHLVAAQQPIQNAVWTAWWAAEGVLALAVFGPGVASYFGPGAAGAVAATAMGSAVRDIQKARALAKSVGEDGTEYDA